MKIIVGSGGALQAAPAGVPGDRAPLRRLLDFLRPIDWLKFYPNLVIFFVLFFLYSLYFFFQGTEKLQFNANFK